MTHKLINRRLGAAGDLPQGPAVDEPSIETIPDHLELLLAALEDPPPPLVDEPPPPPQRRQTLVGVVEAQKQPMLGPAGEHAIGLAGGLGDQIVQHDPQVGAVPPQSKRVPATRQPGRVQARHEALPGGLLVAGRAVDLTRREETLDRLGHAGGVDLVRPDHVVLDRVAEAEDPGLLAAGHQVHQPLLHIDGKRGADAVGVDLVRMERLRLEEDVVRGAVRKPHHLVLDRGTVARAARFDLTAVHRGPVQVGPDQLVGPGGGSGDPAADLRQMGEASAGKGVGQKVAKGNRLGVAKL